MLNDFKPKLLRGAPIKKLAALCLLFNMSPTEVKADQPVHCLRDSAIGEWDFHVSKEAESVDLFKSNEICTHKRPNHVQIVSASHKFQFAQEEVWKVKLLDGYRAQASNAGQTYNGTWSTIYDQAFRVELDNGLRFLTNFRYNLKPSISADPLLQGAESFADVKAGDYAKFDSRCDETMVGFVQ